MSEKSAKDEIQKDPKPPSLINSNNILSEDHDFEFGSEFTDENINTISNCSFSVEGDRQSTHTWDAQPDESSSKVWKYHNPSIF